MSVYVHGVMHLACRQAGAQGAYLEMDDPELIDGPIALSQI